MGKRNLNYLRKLIGMEELHEEDITVVDLEGKVLEGRKPSKETGMPEYI